MSAIQIHGHCDQRFAKVMEEFAKNFDAGLEVGASFAATINGKFVVDIWAGYADAARTRPWDRDTIVNVFSTTKPMTALCALMLADRGLLDLDAPVARYWPEFAEAGKENILVRHLLSHQAGLAAIDEPLPKEAFFDWDRMTAALAAQKPLWEPGTQSGYHVTTFGWLVGEVVRRVTGKTLGTFFREEVAAPLNADFHIGLAEEHEFRVAELILPSSQSPFEPGTLFEKASTNPGGGGGVLPIHESGELPRSLQPMVMVMPIRWHALCQFLPAKANLMVFAYSTLTLSKRQLRSSITDSISSSVFPYAMGLALH